MMKMMNLLNQSTNIPTKTPRGPKYLLGFGTLLILFVLGACSNMLTLNPNREPVVNIAEIGITSLYPGNSVQLNATESFDPDGQTLTAAWRVANFVLTTGATGVNDAVLTGADTFTPTFSAFTRGVYTLELTVTDEYGVQRSSTRNITVANNPPGANAGPDRSVGVVSTTPITIAGTGGDTDEARPPRRDDLWQYRWEMVRQPWTADGAMDGALVETEWVAIDNFADQNTNQGGTAETAFTPPVDGVYTLRLRVRDEGLGAHWGRESTSTMIVSTANNTSPVLAPGTITGPATVGNGGVTITTTLATVATNTEDDRLSAEWILREQPSPQVEFEINMSGNSRTFANNNTLFEENIVGRIGDDDDIQNLVIVPDTGELTFIEARATADLAPGTWNIRIELRVSDRVLDDSVYIYLEWTNP
jgi:hypothetical protein